MNLLNNKTWTEIVTENLKINYKYNKSSIDYVIFDEVHKDMIIAIGFDLSGDFEPSNTDSMGVLLDIKSNENNHDVLIDFYIYKYPSSSENFIFDNPLHFAVSRFEIYFFEFGKHQISDYWKSTNEISILVDKIDENRNEYIKLP